MQVVVTVGATQALAATIHALIEPGDEAVIIEPGARGCNTDCPPHTHTHGGGDKHVAPLNERVIGCYSPQATIRTRRTLAWRVDGAASCPCAT